MSCPSLDRASAAAPPAGKQAPGFYRFKLGSYELTAINDGVWHRPIDATFVRGASWPDVQKAMADAHMPEPGKLEIPFTALLVNTGSKLVLLDTGSGGQMAATAGTLLANLAAAGIQPKDIDTIAVTHFHPDHINGIKTKDDALVFPNAEIMVPAREIAFFMDDGNFSRAPDSARGVFLNARRVFRGIEKTVTQFEPGKEIAPGITPIAAPGHTPGHVVYAVASGDAVDDGLGRHHQPAGTVRAQSGMAADFRHGRPARGREPQALARPRLRRPDAGARVSTSPSRRTATSPRTARATSSCRRPGNRSFSLFSKRATVTLPCGEGRRRCKAPEPGWGSVKGHNPYPHPAHLRSALR